MAHHHFEAIPAAQTFRQLFREIDGAVLATGAAEGDHQILEAELLISADAGVHERQDAGEKLMHALLLLEIFDHRSVFSRNRRACINFSPASCRSWTPASALISSAA